MTPDPVSSALDRAAETGLLPARSRFLVAFSGGPDSAALLHGAAQAAARHGWDLAAGHVHHGWRGREADRDLAFARDQAARLGLPFLSRIRDARDASARWRVSPEAGARTVRYAALHEMAREIGAERVATGHHADDLLESHLVALERRGGCASLAGPRERREDGVVRPFLRVPRREILAWLEERGVSFRRDASNGDLRLARNRIRRRIAAACPEDRAAWMADVEQWTRRRDRLDAEFAEKVAPALRAGPRTVLADAEALSRWEPELQRRAVEAAAEPFARPGHPPMTGREREDLLRRLASGGDFRFEAGRRISIERRGRILAFRPNGSPGAPPGCTIPGSPS